MEYTTLKQLRKTRACLDGYNKLVRHLQGAPFTVKDEKRSTHIRLAISDPISLKTILDLNGFDDALWALKACEQSKDLQRNMRLFAVWCARQVQHLMTDQRSINALNVAENHANGLATDEELKAALKAAGAVWAAGEAAWAKHHATWATHYATWAAGEAAWAKHHATWATHYATWAARETAWENVWQAAFNAVLVARDVVWAAAREDALEAAKEAQEIKFIEMFCS